jgi:hypothetical protein
VGFGRCKCGGCGSGEKTSVADVEGYKMKEFEIEFANDNVRIGVKTSIYNS